MEVGPLPPLVGVAFGRAGVGALAPVLDQPHRLREPQAAAFVDERRLVLVEQGVAPWSVGPTQQVDVIE